MPRKGRVRASRNASARHGRFRRSGPTSSTKPAGTKSHEVRDLGITPQSSAVVTAIIALARSLGLRVIAEGVENLRQMEVLHRLGCGVMQGFLFSRPIPPDDIERWLEQTVLPRKAPWIAQASAAEEPSRAIGGLRN